MPDTLRITVKAPDADIAEQIKETFFKKLYEHSGTKVIFEVPADADADADEIIAAAKDAGCEAAKELHQDELDDAEPVSFW
jgi:NaMN:DMB phosphoribosyltransferase